MSRSPLNLHQISSSWLDRNVVPIRAMPSSSRGRTLVVAVATIAAGLASRSRGLPEPVILYVGDILWGAFFFQCFRLVWPLATRLRLWLWAVTTTELIELSQLWQAPWLVQVRATRLGGLLLGHQFLVSDMVCVALGASIAALLAIAGIPARAVN